MKLKTSTTLITVLTFAFAAPAFAGPTPPADDPAQADTATEVQIETETMIDPLPVETPLVIDDEVKGEVTTSEDLYAPIPDDNAEMDTGFEYESETGLETDIETEFDTDTDENPDLDIDVETDVEIEPEL